MATITRGLTFGSTESVTNTKLHTLVDSATITDIVNADVSAGAAIVASKLDLTGSGFVTTGADNDFTGDNTFAGGFTLTGTSLTDVLGLVYPVGIVVTFGVATNPATLLGIGTWTAIEGKVIVGKAAAGTFNTLDATGGAETVTLGVNETPAHTHGSTGVHTHTIPRYDGSGTSGYFGKGNEITTTMNSGSNGSHTHASVGGGAAHANLQPYIVKFVWQRVS